MAVITPSDLTFSPEEVRSFQEAIFEAMVDYPTITDLHRVIPNVVTNRKIAIIGHLAKITRLDPGCGDGKTDPKIPMSEKEWQPVNLKIWLSECWEPFNETFMVYYLNRGTDKNDLTTTEIFSQWLVEEVGQAALKDALRIIWFADTSVTGPNAADYSQLNGLWKQIFSVVTQTPARRTKIAANDGASYTAQQFTPTDVTNQTATKIFQRLIFDADRRLRAAPDKAIWATRSLTDEYMLERMSVSNIDLAYTRVESGIDTLQIMGVPVYVMDQWDDVLRGDLDPGTKYTLPHRAVMSTKDNLQVGFDTASVKVDDFDVFFDKMTETSNIRGLYKMDTKLILDYMFQAAY